MSEFHRRNGRPLRSNRKRSRQRHDRCIPRVIVTGTAVRIGSLIVFLAGALQALVQAQEPEPESGIDVAGWLAGCWELRRGETVTLEIWMPPEGGAMLGMSRTVQAGTLRDWEQLMLREDGDRLLYVAWPQGQGETGFTSTVLTDSGFTVENLAHDFPQRIIYRRVGADSLVSRIEGPGTSGVRGFEFPMRRIACAQ